MCADWTASGACTSGSTERRRDATRPGRGSAAMTSTTSAEHDATAAGSGATIRAAAIKESPMTEPLVVRRETHISAPPATVFAFLTDPEKILSWMGTEAQTEMHPGGLYLVKGVSKPDRVARG